MNNITSQGLVHALANRYKRLIPIIQQLPPAGARPLTVAGRVCGWITSSAIGAITGLPGVTDESEAVHINAQPSRNMSLNQVLECIALELRNSGNARAWRDEPLDVIGEGDTLGVIERAVMRPLGLLTRAVHLNAWAPDGRMWIAKRADSKFTDPGLWDTLVGGLVSAGESPDTSLVRESQEEAGLYPNDIACREPMRLILRIHRRLPEGYQVEDMLASDCILSESVQPINQDGEVSEIRLATTSELWEMINEGMFTHEAEVTILDSLKRQ